MLSSFIKKGHDNIDAVGLAVDGRDHALQILIMVIR